METLTKVTEFIQSNLAVNRGKPIQPDEPLFSGLVDSVDMFRLIEFLEEEFNIEVEDDDLQPGNFGTVRSIVTYVERRSGTLA